MLVCNATGHPNLTYRWARVDDSMVSFPFTEEQSGRVDGQNTDTLIIRRIYRMIDNGTYACDISLFGQLVAVAYGELTTRGKGCALFRT